MSKMLSQYFEYFSQSEQCECKKCGKLLSAKKSSNLRRHLILIHKIDFSAKDENTSEDEYEMPSKRNKSIADIKKDKTAFIKCCVGLVTVKNIPLRIFDDEEFFKPLISPLESRFNTSLNSRNISTYIETCSSKIGEIISKRLHRKMISVKIDIATRMERSVLGINVQYIKDFKICINTIGMIQLNEKHKSSYLKDEFYKCLKSFGIELNQIYSSTTDNGANILKVSKILQELQEESFTEDCDAESSNFPTTSQPMENNEDSIQKTLSSIISVVRCAAHTIQLAAYDVLKELAPKMAECRSIAKKLRNFIKSQRKDIALPTLDNMTRWNSSYDMVNSILKTKSLVEDEELVPESIWQFSAEFVKVFKPLADCTIKFQTEQYVIGDFYRDWLCCELEIEAVAPDSPYGKLLLDSMKKRKATLLDNDAFLAAIYLDPRFTFEGSTILTEEQKITAINHLIKTRQIMKKLEEGNSGISSNENISFEKPESAGTNPSPYEKLERRMQLMISSRSDSTERLTFKQKLVLLESGKKMPLDTNILQYYKTADYDGDVKRIIEVALAVPATQVSVERAFSALSLVLTKLRGKLSSETINHILLTKLNFALLQNIDLG